MAVKARCYPWVGRIPGHRGRRRAAGHRTVRDRRGRR